MKRNNRLESCSLESEGDTEDDEDTDGRDTRSHTQDAFLNLLPFKLPDKRA